METSTVSEKGQFIIPIKIRKKYGIKPGTKIKFQLLADGIKLIPMTTEYITQNIGFLNSPESLIEVLLEEKIEERNL